MNETKMLKEIHEKIVIIPSIKQNNKEKLEEKEKTPKQKAEEKFKRVGTKLNQEDLKKFEIKLKEKDMNQSSYIKYLINDVEKELMILKHENRALKVEIDELTKNNLNTKTSWFNRVFKTFN